MLLYYIETNVCGSMREREFIDTAQQETKLTYVADH